MSPRRHLVVALALVTGCGATALPKPVEVSPGPIANAPRIVLLQSTTNPLFDAPAKAFTEQAQAEVIRYAGIEAPGPLVKAIRAHAPTLIVTFGSPATTLAIESFPDVPVLFTMVVNYRRLGLAGHKNVMGVAMESSTTSEFSQFRMILPELRRVLAFYVAADSQSLVDAARAELAGLGIELDAVAVGDTGGVEAGFAKHGAGADAVWLLNDPVVMKRDTVALLRAQSRRAKIPFVASLSDEFTRQGALMSVSTDLAGLGSQAAAMARMHLEQGRSPAELGVQAPMSTHLVVNLGVARAIGVELDGDVLPFVDEVIDPQVSALP
jgi:putative ABC transport system substrate-binding protein